MPLKNAQAAPSATTETDVYTCPALKETVISTISICNRGSTVALVRLAIVTGGGATQNKNYLLYDTIIPPNDNYSRTCGDVMMAGDILRVYASNGNISVTVSFNEGDIT